MLGYLYGKSFGSKIAGANRKEGDRLGAGPSTGTDWRLRTHMEATGGYVKEIGRAYAQAIFEPNHFPYKHPNISQT